MSSTTASLLMYRYGTEGLEVFLVNSSEQSDGPAWEIPATEISSGMSEQSSLEDSSEEIIHLGEEIHPEGMISGLAFEESEETFVLPLQSVLGKTESPLKLRRKSALLMEKGAFFCAKEAVKKVFPNEVAMIKELQEILSIRNIVKYL